MKKISLIFLGCAVSLSLFSGCSENSCDDCCCEKKIIKNMSVINKSKKAINVEEKMITTDSGLKYEVLAEGNNSEMPKTGQRVTVHYTGWLEKDGKKDENAKFDCSVDWGVPFEFTIGVGQVIKGWDEGLVGMNIGDKRI